MKLIITGATGLVATEVLRQSLRMREITHVVAVARKPVSAPSDVGPADAAKLQSVVVEDYERYPDEARAQFAGADACIWWVCPRSCWGELAGLIEIGPWPSRRRERSRSRLKR